MFYVLYSLQALRFLRDADVALRKRIAKKIEELRPTPALHDTKGIHGYREKLFRVRVGDYRILYEIEHDQRRIGIVKIDKRPSVYDH